MENCRWYRASMDENFMMSYDNHYIIGWVIGHVKSSCCGWRGLRVDLSHLNFVSLLQGFLYHFGNWIMWNYNLSRCRIAYCVFFQIPMNESKSQILWNVCNLPCYIHSKWCECDGSSCKKTNLGSGNCCLWTYLSYIIQQKRASNNNYAIYNRRHCSLFSRISSQVTA